MSYPGERAKVVGRIYVSDSADDVTLADLDLAGQSNKYPGLSCTGGSCCNPDPVVGSCGNGSLVIAGTGVSLSGNDITNDNSDICILLGNGYGAADDVSITGNRIHNCGDFSLKGKNSAHAIYASHTDGGLIANNILYGHSAFAVKLAPRATNATVEHNVVDFNGVGVMVGDQQSEQPNPEEPDYEPCVSSTDASHDNLISDNVITRAQERWNFYGFWVPTFVDPSCFDVEDDDRGNVLSGNCFYADALDSSGENDWHNSNDGVEFYDPYVTGANATTGGFYDDGTNFHGIPSDQTPMPPIYVDPDNRNYHLNSASGSNNDCLEAASVTDAAAAANVRWQAPFPLSNSDTSGHDFSDPDVAIGNDGTAASVWIHDDGSNNRVEAVVRQPGGATGADSWNYASPSVSKPSVSTLSVSGKDASDPQISVGGTGSNRVAVATWVIWNGTTYIVQASVWHAGTWGSVIDLTPSTQWADYPSVSVGRDGTAVVAWQYTTDYAAARVRPAGSSTSFGTEASLSASGHDISDLSVATTADGKAVATWLYDDGSDDVVRSSNFNGSTWSSATTISQNGRDAADPSVAISQTSSGATAVATWRRYNGSNWIVQAAIRGTSGSWASAANLSASGANADTPTVGVGSNSATDGTAVVTWRRWTGSEFVIQAAARSAGGSFGSATTLSDTGYDAETPEVAVGGDGSALAVWYRWDTQTAFMRVQSRALPAGGTWGAISTISSVAPSADAMYPVVAVGSTQSASAVWPQWNGTVFRMFTSNFFF